MPQKGSKTYSAVTRKSWKLHPILDPHWMVGTKPMKVLKVKLDPFAFIFTPLPPSFPCQKGWLDCELSNQWSYTYQFSGKHPILDWRSAWLKLWVGNRYNTNETCYVCHFSQCQISFDHLLWLLGETFVDGYQMETLSTFTGKRDKMILSFSQELSPLFDRKWYFAQRSIWWNGDPTCSSSLCTAVHH